MFDYVSYASGTISAEYVIVERYSSIGTAFHASLEIVNVTPEETTVPFVTVG